MFLEKIVLKGFKSFSNTTKVEFGEGMSIIVGPNGSGKSNINDAIKWVLGEGKKSELRASSSTDMIFNGTKFVSEAASAEVSLYFNNEKKKLNTDAKKVKVTRKIVRETAKSTYYIDGEVARRKDVKNLFLGSGLGNTDLSIISQSSVTKLTEANSQEVKDILNEAAGVSGFMQTKTETVRELSKVSDSKEIFEVKVNQLSSRYNSLKKASEKAVKFMELRRELNEIELPYIFHRMVEDMRRRVEIGTEFDTQNELIEKYKKELKELKSVITSADNTNNKLRSRISDLELKANEAKRSTSANNDDIEKAIKQTIADAKVLEGEIDKINESLSINKSERITNASRMQDIQVELDALKEQKLNLEVKKNISASRNKSWVEKGTQYVLDNKGLFPGAVGLLSDIVKYDDAHAVAVNEAMGAALKNLVVDTNDSAKEIIKTLRANNLGRTTIAPFRGRKEASEIAEVIKQELTKYSGYIGTLDSVIKYAEKYERLVKSSSARVLVFDNIDNASLAAKNLEYKYKVVTLEGDLILPGMILKGGSAKSNKKTNFDADINTVEQSIKELLKEAIKLNKANEKLQDKISTTDSNRIKFVERKRYLEVNLNNHLLSYKETTGKDYNFNNFKLEKEFISAEKAEIEIAKLKADFDVSYKKWQEAASRESEIREAMVELVETNSNHKFELKEINDRISFHEDILITDYNTNMDMIKPSEITEADIEDKELVKEIERLRREVKSLGMVDVSSIEEFERIATEYETAKESYEEISNTHKRLMDILEDLEGKIESRIKETFEKVNVKFHESFQLLFKGGEAMIEWEDEENIIESGINIIAQPPGKKLSSMKLFSGGEKTLTALSLIFAMNLVREIPLLILDEPEAALDEANVERFARFAKKVNEKSQVIVTTHRPGTMQQADNIFGVAMQEKGITTIISVQLSEALKMTE